MFSFLLLKALIATCCCFAFWHFFLQPQIKALLADWAEFKRLYKELKDEE